MSLEDYALAQCPAEDALLDRTVFAVKPKAYADFVARLDAPPAPNARREAHEALVELKKLVDDAAKITHAAELESFRAAISRDQNNGVRRSLQDVIERLRSPDFERVVLVVREKLETALSI